MFFKTWREDIKAVKQRDPAARNALEMIGVLLIPGCEGSAEEAVAAAGDTRCLVIGGESVYRALLDACDTAYVTRIDAAWPADSFFPDLDRRADWYVAGAEAPLEHEGLVFRYVTYRRRP